MCQARERGVAPRIFNRFQTQCHVPAGTRVRVVSFFDMIERSGGGPRLQALRIDDPDAAAVHGDDAGAAELR